MDHPAPVAGVDRPADVPGPLQPVDHARDRPGRAQAGLLAQLAGGQRARLLEAGQQLGPVSAPAGGCCWAGPPPA
jgi:hypothetical protein